MHDQTAQKQGKKLQFRNGIEQWKSGDGDLTQPQEDMDCKIIHTKKKKKI